MTILGSAAAKLFSSELAAANGLASDRYPQTVDEGQRAERALAQELDEKLTLGEREQITLDIYGVRAWQEAPSNDAAWIAAQLAAMDRHVVQLDDDNKVAYERAKKRNGAFVDNMRLSFLRTERWDAQAAAQRMALHFQVKYELFVQTQPRPNGNPRDDDEILARNVTWEDLGELERIHAQTGLLQIGTKRDLAGRAILFSVLTSTKFSRESENAKFRAVWYILMSAAANDKEMQENGLIMIVFNFDNFMVPLHTMRRKMSLRLSVPINNVAVHYCYRNSSLHPLVMGFQLLLMSNNGAAHKARPRFCLHFGNFNTIAFKLQTYGIPMDSCPVIKSLLKNADSFQLSNSWHLDWLELIRKMEPSQEALNKKQQSLQDAGTKDETIVLFPRRFDVLLGQSSTAVQHTGTVRFRHLLRMHWDDYHKASRRGKTQVADRIVSMIHESQGRFLREQETWTSAGNLVFGWVPVEHRVARDKVSYSFRNMRKNEPTTHAESGKDSCGTDAKSRGKPVSKRAHSEG